MIDMVRIRDPLSSCHTQVGMTAARNKSFSRLDYIYCCRYLAEKVGFCKTMYDSQIVSDHMPIWIALVTKTIKDSENDEDVKIQNNASPSSWEKWREKASATLRRNEDKIKRKLKSGNISEIDEAVQIFTKIAIEEAKRTLKQVENVPL